MYEYKERFEFVLYVNDNIVCQRFFNIPKYNENFGKSIEVKQMMDDLTKINGYVLGIIPTYLKKKSVNYLWDTYNPYYNYDKQNKVYNKNYDTFRFEFIVDEKVVSVTEFPNYFFKLSAKNVVNIIEIVPKIINTIIKHSSKENLSLMIK